MRSTSRTSCLCVRKMPLPLIAPINPEYWRLLMDVGRTRIDLGVGTLRSWKPSADDRVFLEEANRSEVAIRYVFRR